MTESMQEALWLTSTDYQQLLYVTPAFETIWGCTLESLYGYPDGYLEIILDSIAPEDRGKVMTAFTQKFPWESDLEYRIVRPDGSIRWVRSRSFLIPNFGEGGNGEWVYPEHSRRGMGNGKSSPWLSDSGCLLATLSEDITDRKQAELELQVVRDRLEKGIAERTAELLQAQEQLRAVLDTVPGCVSWISSEGLYLGVNQHLADIFNLPSDAFIGQEVGFLQNSPQFVEFIEQFLTSCNQTAEKVIEIPVKGLPRNYLIAVQKCQQGTQIVAVGIDITERKLAQETLQAQRDLLQTVLDTNPNLIFVKDLDSKLVLVNQAFTDFYGITPEDAIGKTTAQLHPHSGEVERFIAQDRYVKETLEPQFIPEEDCCNLTGEVRWYQTIKKPIFDRDGQLCQILGVCTDITERKQAQEDLEAQKEFLQNIIDTNPNMIYVKDREDKYVLANQVFAQRCGMRVDELLGKTTADLHDNPDDIERFIAEDREVLTTLQPQFIAEEASRTPTGEMRWYQTIKTPLISREGQVIQVLGVSTDITERKLTEEQLRNSQTQLNLALDAARMGIWDWTIETGKIAWSNSLERLFGLAPNTFDGHYETMLAMIYPEDRDRVHQSTQLFLEKGKYGAIEFRIVWPDGSIHWMESKGQVLSEAMGKPVRMIGINLDITNRKQAEMQIQASLREKEVLLQEIHHRVKNNLQVISSLLDLQSHHIEDPTTLELFRESQNRVKSMALVHEKLYQSRDFACINFAEYIENLTSYLCQAYALQASNLAIELNIDNVNLNINTAIPCGLMVGELVSNALKYAFPNYTGGKIQIALHAETDNRYTLTVSDNGIGIPSNLDFRNTKSLGLQLVNVLTEQVEGTIELDRSCGTEFRIRFSQING
ncbi:MAG TPA: hypothetical protein DDZ80_21810 [Cyanobacteria bacterium UBA8803]|nr:hypothetical protein [Cyanobacteria bacterium UBA9273]HBL60969.1 hypothetical protein [Cyanobacteria bacterium UBA8803]